MDKALNYVYKNDKLYKHSIDLTPLIQFGGEERRMMTEALLQNQTTIAAFATLKEGFTPDSKLLNDLREHVAQKIGSIVKPDKIVFSTDLPKTRSGKIMRRLLRDIAEG